MSASWRAHRNSPPLIAGMFSRITASEELRGKTGRIQFLIGAANFCVFWDE